MNTHEPVSVLAKELGDVLGGHVLIGGEKLIVVNFHYFISVLFVFADHLVEFVHFLQFVD